MSSAPGNLAERFQIVEGFNPVSLATATNEGDWVSMKNFGACHVLFHGAPSATATEPAIVKLEQAKLVNGTEAKALNFTDVYYKQSATAGGSLATGGGTFTRATQTATDRYSVGASNGDKTNLVVISIPAEALDVNNGFDCIRATVLKTGTTPQIGTLLYLLEGGRYIPPISAITD